MITTPILSPAAMTSLPSTAPSASGTSADANGFGQALQRATDEATRPAGDADRVPTPTDARDARPAAVDGALDRGTRQAGAAERRRGDGAASSDTANMRRAGTEARGVARSGAPKKSSSGDQDDRAGRSEPALDAAGGPGAAPAQTPVAQATTAGASAPGAAPDVQTPIANVPAGPQAEGSPGYRADSLAAARPGDPADDEAATSAGVSTLVATLPSLHAPRAAVAVAAPGAPGGAADAAARGLVRPAAAGPVISAPPGLRVAIAATGRALPGTPRSATAATDASAVDAAQARLPDVDAVAPHGLPASQQPTTPDAPQDARASAAGPGQEHARDQRLPPAADTARATAAPALGAGTQDLPPVGTGVEHDGPHYSEPVPAAGQAAVAPPAALPLPAPAGLAAVLADTLGPAVGSREFASALGARVAVFARDGVEHAQLNVHPADMGPISVQLALTGTQVRVELAAEAPATRQLLEQALPSLASALREGGFTLTGGGVFQQARDGAPARDPGSAGARADDRARSDRRIGAAAPTLVTRAVRLDGLVDLYA